jgi:hypothetical protein
VPPLVMTMVMPSSITAIPSLDEIIQANDRLLFSLREK